jgi:predicted DCC family thiol-disulfide oxidoreductase YuxK
MNYPIVLFDDQCPFCRRSVTILLRLDRHHRLRFAPLKGKTAAALLRGKNRSLKKEDSLILFEPRVWLRGRAVFRTLWLIGGKYRLLGGWLCFLPFGTDTVYRWVARHRHVLRAKAERLPASRYILK